MFEFRNILKCIKQEMLFCFKLIIPELVTTSISFLQITEIARILYSKISKFHTIPIIMKVYHFKVHICFNIL